MRELGQDLVELGVLLGRLAAELVLHPLTLCVAELVGDLVARLADRQHAVGAPSGPATLATPIARSSAASSRASISAA